MPKVKIPRSARNSIKRALLENEGKLSEPELKAKNDTKKAIRKSIEAGSTPRTKITWAVDVGDLVRIKSKKNSNNKEDYGIVTYKKSRVNYSNQEDEFIIVMTPTQSEIRLHPKSIEVLQRNENSCK